MGWLRTLMGEAATPVRSYGELARLALAHPDWPADTRPQARSLAALLSKLDRDQELEWLSDRPAATHALAEVLGTSPAAFERLLRQSIETQDVASGRVRLDDVPFARVIDLAGEPLPPGIPDVVLQPSRWQRVLWRAPSGSGRSLVGRWLAVRGLAATVEAGGIADVHGQVSQSGPIYVEVQAQHDVASIIAAAPRGPVCIAGPFGPDTAQAEQAGFVVVASPEPGRYVDALVRWLAPRLSEDAGFDEDVTADLLLRLVESGVCRTLGDLLGAAGLIDELGPREMERHSPAELARRFVARRLRALRDAGRDTAAWHAEGYEVLAAMSRNRMMDATIPWSEATTHERWARLVPAELQRAVDPDWLRVTMAPQATPSTLKELERALRSLPPGGFQVVKALESAGLLRKVTPRGDLAIRPQWLATHVAAEATRTLAEGSPFEWGEALLEPASASAVQQRVNDRVTRDAEAVIDELLELGGAASPAHAAATEAVARAVGLGLLRGELEPPESLDALWDAAAALVVDVAGEPTPRIGMPDTGEGLFTTGAYHLAMLAISETLPPGAGRRHAQLRPWLVPQPRRTLVPVLDAIGRCLAHDGVRPALAGPACALVARLSPTLTSDAVASVHPLEGPARLVEILSTRAPTWEDVTPVLADSRTTAALPAVADQADVGWPKVARAIFEAWRRAGGPSPEVLARAASDAPTLWDHAPAAPVARMIRDGSVEGGCLPWRSLSPSTWERLVTELGTDTPAEAYATPHADSVRGALLVTLPRAAAAATAWRHHAEPCIDAVRSHIRATPEAVAGFVAAATAQDAAAILEVLRAELEDLTRGRAFVPFLHRVVLVRTPGWRDAYELLAALERAR